MLNSPSFATGNASPHTQDDSRGGFFVTQIGQDDEAQISTLPPATTFPILPNLVDEAPSTLGDTLKPKEKHYESSLEDHHC
jgi:hypothetical protein